jgi:hypothetical protein
LDPDGCLENVIHCRAMTHGEKQYIITEPPRIIPLNITDLHLTHRTTNGSSHSSKRPFCGFGSVFDDDC